MSNEGEARAWVVSKQLPLVLSKYGDDLTFHVYENAFVPSNQDDEYVSLILNRLARKHKNNVLLLRSDVEFEQAIIQSVAMQIVTQPSEAFLNTSIFKLRLDELLTTSQVRGEFKAIVDEIQSSNRRIILYIQNFMRLIQYSQNDLFDVDFRRAIRLGHVQFIYSMSRRQYREKIENDAGLERSSTTVNLVRD